MTGQIYYNLFTAQQTLYIRNELGELVETYTLMPEQIVDFCRSKGIDKLALLGAGIFTTGLKEQLDIELKTKYHENILKIEVIE